MIKHIQPDSKDNNYTSYADVLIKRFKVNENSRQYSDIIEAFNPKKGIDLASEYPNYDDFADAIKNKTNEDLFHIYPKLGIILNIDPREE